MAKVTVSIRLAWWLKPYLYALVFVAITMRAVPDEEKLARVIAKGLRVKVNPA